MNKLKLNIDLLNLKQNNISGYDLFKSLGLIHLANSLNKQKDKPKITNSECYFTIKNINFIDSLKPLGFIEKYSDWTNKLEGYSLTINNYNLLIPYNKTPKICYIKSNMTNKKHSKELIEVLRKLIDCRIVKYEVIEDVKIKKDI